MRVFGICCLLLSIIFFPLAVADNSKSGGDLFKVVEFGKKVKGYRFKIFEFRKHVVYSRKPIKWQKNWETQKTKNGLVYSITHHGKLLRIIVSGEMQGNPNLFSAVLKEKLGGNWLDSLDIPKRSYTEGLRIIGDLDGDGFPEFLRLESMVECQGGVWADVVKIYPKFSILAEHLIPPYPCI